MEEEERNEEMKEEENHPTPTASKCLKLTIAEKFIENKQIFTNAN